MINYNTLNSVLIPRWLKIESCLEFEKYVTIRNQNECIFKFMIIFVLKTFYSACKIKLQICYEELIFGYLKKTVFFLFVYLTLGIHFFLNFKYRHAWQ